LARIANAAPKPIPEIEVTPEMTDAGCEIIFSTPGVAEFGVFFSGDELAAKVYRAMAALDRSRLPQPTK